MSYFFIPSYNKTTSRNNQHFCSSLEQQQGPEDLHGSSRVRIAKPLQKKHISTRTTKTIRSLPRSKYLFAKCSACFLKQKNFSRIQPRKLLIQAPSTNGISQPESYDSSLLCRIINLHLILNNDSNIRQAPYYYIRERYTIVHSGTSTLPGKSY